MKRHSEMEELDHFIPNLTKSDLTYTALAYPLWKYGMQLFGDLQKLLIRLWPMVYWVPGARLLLDPIL